MAIYKEVRAFIKEHMHGYTNSGGRHVNGTRVTTRQAFRAILQNRAWQGAPTTGVLDNTRVIRERVKKILNAYCTESFYLCDLCGIPECEDTLVAFRGSEVGYCGDCADRNLTEDHQGEMIRTRDVVTVYASWSDYDRTSRGQSWHRQHARDEGWYRSDCDAYIIDYNGEGGDNYGMDSEEDEDNIRAPRPSDAQLVHDYHATSHLTKFRKDEWTERMVKAFGVEMALGFELEMYAPRGREANYMAKLLLANGGDKMIRGFERDGSLTEDRNGLEMVTQPCSLPAHRKWLLESFPRQTGGRSHDTTTCGLHVHVTRQGMSTAHQLRLIRFMGAPVMQAMLNKIARREGGNYCKRPVFEQGAPHDGRWGRIYSQGSETGRIEYSKTVEYLAYEKDPYRWEAANVGKKRPPLALVPHSTDPKYVRGFDHGAVDFTHSETVEFRLFKGTLKPETIVATLEFVWAVVLFTRHAPSRDLNTYTPANFIGFCNKPEHAQDTKYLRAYMAHLGLNADVKYRNGRIKESIRPRVPKKPNEGVFMVNKKDMRGKKKAAQTEMQALLKTVPYTYVPVVHAFASDV